MIEAKVVKKQSKKGNEFICVELTFPNGYKKLVFLDRAEEFMAIEFM